MTKELYVSSTPHETKVAINEDDQLAEIYFERENEYTLAGSIYKGRVTRVLPGMQSAFVDIGLERDAFLYVSDFFEVEDAEDEFDPVVLPRPVEARPQVEPLHEPAAAAEQPPESELEQAIAEPAAMPEMPRSDRHEPPQDRGDWRGRHRGRRGRRGRGFPESKFARGPEDRPEHGDRVEPAEAREFGPPPGYQPIILPGESISKYPRSAEEHAETKQTSEAQPMVLPGESISKYPKAAEEHGEPKPAPEHQAVVLPGESISKYPRAAEQLGEPKQAPEHQPIILPGESISKYAAAGEESPAEAQEQRAERPERVERPQRPERPSRRDFGPPPGYQPIILPGESISKYRRLQTQAPAVTAEAEHEMPTEPLPATFEAEQESQTSEAAVVERAVQEPTPESAQSEDYTETASAQSAVFEDERSSAEPEPQVEEHQQPARDDERRFEQMNVASIFGGDEAAMDNGTNTVAETESELHFEHDPHAEPTSEDHEAEARDEHELSTAPTHTFEEEEIEEEEGELPSIHEHFDDTEFEELEEETIEPAEFAKAEREELAAGEATEAIEETDAEQAAEDEAYELEESEEDQGENGDGETYVEQEQSEGEEGRAEVRASSGTAGYQQRTQRFDRDRRGGRGRRGGRRGMRPPRRDVQRQHVMISDVLKEGQEVLIQIAKEPIGKKGARITSHIALPGRFLVYMPTVNHIGVSRKIQADEERQRLKRIVMSERENGHGGFIVRTAAEHVGEEDLRADIRFLKNLWNEIKSRADNSKAPALIYHDLNLVERVLRDQVTTDYATVWVDNESEYERILRFANRFQPGLVRKVKLYTKETPLFEQFGIQEEINKSLKSKVWLKSGGYIVINQTEALVAIDVNTGKYVGKTTRLEDTIVKTNVDAIKEIVRQVRLRDLGGIIVIDFIDMDERRNRQKVMQALEEELKHDRAPSKVLAFNDFGLVAITRKRVKQSLERTLGAPCPYCSGTAFVKSVTTVCNEIYVEMRKMRRHLEDNEVLLRVNPEVAKALKANGGKWQQELEELVGRTVIIKPDPSLHQEQFDM